MAGASIALGIVAVFGGTGAGAASHSSHRGLILSPRPGARLSARPTLIRVRTGRHPTAFRARLNGQSIGRYFSHPSRAGVRKLRASASFGLRHGRNRIRVRVRRGKRVNHGKLGFRVRRNRPLAAAGFDRVVGVGDRVFVGARSRSHLGWAGRNRSALRHHWTVVKVPHGSAPGGGLSGAHRPQPSLSPKVPGRYRVRLTVKARDGKTGSDLVNIDADPVPAVRVDTMTEASGGKPGIKVGDQTYYAEPVADGKPPWFQVLVLDREKLTKVSNTTYGCDRASNGFCIDDELQRGLDKLVNDSNPQQYLAIVANHMSDPSWAAPGYVPFPKIGAQNYRAENLPSNHIASFSAIGVPGTHEGDGTWHFAPSGGTAGRMNDWLIRNQDLVQKGTSYYTFMPSDRINYDTQAAGSSGAGDNVVKIGGETFGTKDLPAPHRPQGPGFQVVAVDPTTLKPALNQYYSTRFLDCSGDKNEIDRMAQDLKEKVNASPIPLLVVVASVGVPAVPPDCNRPDNDVNLALYSLVNEIEYAGGTRSAIFKALDPGLSKQTSYTLVGRSGARGGNGIESIADNTSKEGMSTAPLSGALARTGANYSFQPQAVPVVGTGSSSGHDPSAGAEELSKALVQPSTPWPEQGDVGKTAAIKWIGKSLLQTEDLRSQYWTETYNPLTWSNRALRIQGLDYPGADKVDFSVADFSWAKAELAGPLVNPAVPGGEIGWLINTHTYLDDLASPFSDNTLASWAAFNGISNRVNDLVGVGVDQKTQAFEENSFAAGKGVLSALPVVGKAAAKAFKAADVIYAVVEHFRTVNGEAKGEQPFSVTAGSLGEELATRLDNSRDMLMRRIPNAIAGDYGKLKLIGSCADKTGPWPGCPFDHSDWQFTQDDKAGASGAFLNSMKTWAYGSLLNTKYKLYRLPVWWRTKVGDNEDYYGRTADGFWYPFDGIPDSATAAKPIYRNIPTYGHTIYDCGPFQACKFSGETWQIYALGYLEGKGTLGDRWKMRYPKAEVTDPIFAPLNRGGLTADPESFYDTYFNASTLDHYPEDTSPVGWCVAGIQAPCG
jgi:hypothetical protein